MNRKTIALIHISVWIVLYLSPLTYINHGEGVSLPHFLMLSIAPTIVLIVFYANYLWLTPKYYVSGEKRYYFAANIFMVVAFGFFIHNWMEYTHQLFDDGYHANLHHSLLTDTLLIARNIVNLIISVAIATTIQLAMRWRKADNARLEAEKARTEAELNSLRSQINPHFLLNTLNNIYALTAINTERAQGAIQQLSKLLRYLLYDLQEREVPLSSEVQFIENYVALMKIRLPQNVDVEAYFHIANPQLHVAPTLIISLVENAFKHGVSPTEKSFIHVSIVSDDKTIVFDVENSNHPKNATDHSGHGLGIKQVQRHLDLSYPNHYEWERGVSADGSAYHSTITIHLK